MHRTPAKRTLELRGPLDLRQTLGPLRTGPRDPTFRFAGDAMLWSFHSSAGPTTLGLHPRPGAIDAEAWGPGAAHVLETLEDRLGLNDDPESFAPTTPALRRLVRRFPGMRLARVDRVAELLVPVVLGQLVTWQEAARAWRRLVHAHGTEAPGPPRMWLPAEAKALAHVSRAAFIAAGALGRQGRTIQGIGAHVRYVERVLGMDDPVAIAAHLQKLPGVGPWTAGLAMLGGLGLADAVPVGDFHLPNMVAWNLAGEPRADDARMLELLEPFAPHRGRLVRLLMMGGQKAPARGPRHAIRPLSER